MADDKDSKTEEPTGKKLSDARDKGEYVSSQEMRHVITLITLLFLIWGMAENSSHDLRVTLGNYLGNVHNIPSGGSGILQAMNELIINVFYIIIFPLMAFLIAGLVATRIQHQIKLTPDKIKLDISKLSLMKGAKKVISVNQLIELIKSVFKLIIIGSVVLIVVWPELKNLEIMPSVPLSSSLALLLDVLFKIIFGVLLAVIAITALDYIHKHREYMQKMRMTKQEVKDENKQAQGDPKIKAKLAQIRFDKARARMMQAVPEADVVITNPTHYAIALEYKHETMEVPVLLAKGVDAVALRIREVAEEHNIAIMENAPLARALYATVELGEEIPPDHYKVVAEIIGHVLKLKQVGIVPASRAN